MYREGEHINTKQLAKEAYKGHFIYIDGQYRSHKVLKCFPDNVFIIDKIIEKNAITSDIYVKTTSKQLRLL